MTVTTFNDLLELNQKYRQAAEAEAVHEAALIEQPDCPHALRDWELSVACTENLREQLRKAGLFR